MPTGYTHKLYEGEEQSFEDFLLTCARAFCHIELRDSPLGPIPNTEYEERPYHREELEKAREKLSEVEKMSLGDCEEAANKEFIDETARWYESKKSKEAMAGRYGLMLGKVKAWEPPTEKHQALQDYMIQQLETSIEHDCKIYEKPVKTDATDWQQTQIEMHEHSIAYHEREIVRERELAEGNNDWIRQLFESIDRETVPA